MSETITHVVGDLFAYKGRAIAHGCNTHGVMGAGIAKIIADKWGVEVYLPYMKLCSYLEFLPGSAQFCYTDGPIDYVINLGTQDHPGPHASYWWVTLAFANMFEGLHARGINEVAIPRIGCGIGGLKWHGVEEAIQICQAKRPGISVMVYTHPFEADKAW